MPITFIRQESTRHTKQSLDEIRTVLHFFAKFLDVYRPDVMLTYGGDPITQGMIAVAKHRAIPVVFALHNFAYKHAEHFSKVDYCIVPSEFASQALSRQGRPRLPGAAQPGRLGARARRQPEPAVRDVCQSGALQRGLSVCPDRQGAGAAAARYPASGRREPRDTADARRLRAQDRGPSQYPDHAGHDRPAAVLAVDQDRC